MRPYRLAAAAMFLAACTSSTGPDASRSSWVLESANGAVAPALVQDVTYPDTHERVQLFVEGDTLTTDGGLYTQRAHLVAYSNGALTGRLTLSDHGRVTRTGSAAHFESDYLQNVVFDAVIDAQGRLSLTQDLPREGTLAAYVLRPM